MERLVIVGLDGRMTNLSNSDTTLIIGANGKTGRRVAERLTALGHAVRGVSRSTTPRFDWYDPTTWPAALDGVTRAYVTFQPDLAVPGSVDIIRAFGAAASEHGVERLVLLSGRGEPEAQACEQVLLGGDVDTTVVRCSFFAQNFSEHFLVDAVRAGVVALPAGDVREPIVDADDIADAVVTVLTETGHIGRVYELTGPRLLSFHDVAAELSAAIGNDIVYVSTTPEEYVAAAVGDGVPVDEAEMLADLFAHIFDGHNASLADGVAEVLGRPARDFAAFAAAAAATGVWDVEQIEHGTA
jgi:uncharacterized protein YbjT (DUF2867 family)